MLLQGRDHLRLILSETDGELLTEAGGELLGAWEAAPSSTGSVEFDALLAALARHEFDAAGRIAPDWTNIAPLAKAWIPEHPFLTPQRVIATTPDCCVN